MTDPANIFWTWAAFAFVFGTLIGSFLNVVIYRVPAGLSIVRPASRCPVCETPIRWYDNVPIVSWLILRAKCRDCGTRIPARYAGVEALTGLMSLAVFFKEFGGMRALASMPSEEMLLVGFVIYALHFAFVALLITITFVDFDHFLIPHEFTLPGIVLGLAFPWIVRALMGERALLHVWPPVTPWMSLAGAIAGFLSIIAIFYLYLALRGIEGIGGGDATLMALVGAWLGLPALVFVFFAASLQGVIAAGVSTLFGSNFVRDSSEIFTDDEPSDPKQAPPPSQQPRDAAPEHAVQAPEGIEMEREPAISEEDEPIGEGRPAVPFGPFISLAAVEFLLLGPYLPAELSFIYLYM